MLTMYELSMTIKGARQTSAAFALEDWEAHRAAWILAVEYYSYLM